jgi:hypothetical protein
MLPDYSCRTCGILKLSPDQKNAFREIMTAYYLDPAPRGKAYLVPERLTHSSGKHIHVLFCMRNEPREPTQQTEMLLHEEMNVEHPFEKERRPVCAVLSPVKIKTNARGQSMLF